MSTRGIGEFVGRDWKAVRDAQDTYWGDRIGRLGPLEGLAIAEHLRFQMRLRDPARPSPSDREADLIAQVRLAELLRRASPARRG